MPFTYLLGDSRPEGERLRTQAELWDPVSHALFDRVGVARGWKVLEIGPGRGSLHAELKRRVDGPVDAVEQSPAFAAALTGGNIQNAKLLDAELPRAHYDFIFARWVFLFLPEPLRHLRKLAAALKPGGIIAIQDYFRDTFALVPMPDGWDALVAADHAFFALEGGDANAGARMPQLFREAGLETLDVVPHVKSGHPGSPRLALAHRLLPRHPRALRRAPAAHARDRGAHLSTLARRRARSRVAAHWSVRARRHRARPMIVRSNSFRMRLYSSAQLDGSTNE